MGRFLGGFFAALAVAGVVTLGSPGVARADMCNCEVGSRTDVGRGTLAATFGALGLGALFVERQRRARRRR